MALIPNLTEIKDQAPVTAPNAPTAQDDTGHDYIMSHSVGEFDLRIRKTDATKSKRTGRNGVQFIIDIIDEDNATSIFHSIWFGNDGTFTADDEEKSDNMWRMVKDFIRALGMDPEEEHESEDFENLEFSANIEYSDGVDTSTNRQEYPAKNEIGRITGSN